jgi:hypothetical protein
MRQIIPRTGHYAQRRGSNQIRKIRVHFAEGVREMEDSDRLGITAGATITEEVFRAARPLVTALKR